MHISKQSFGFLENGEEVFLIKMKNDSNIEVEIITFGAIIKSILTPNLNGQMGDVVLGKDDLAGYVEDDSCLGAVVGPVAGRIADAKAIVGGKILKLDANDGENTLHGGSAALHRKNWKAEISETENSLKAELTYEAKDLEGGFSGNRLFKTTYILNNKNQLLVYFDASTDQDTLVNLSTHSYFNLSGAHQSIYDHTLMLNSQKYLSVREGNIPDGIMNFVLGTPFNFSRGAQLGEALKEIDFGIDHAYVINKQAGAFGISAKAVHEPSGRTMDLVTDQPVVVVYTANYYDGTSKGKKGLPIRQHDAFCLEPQIHPDAPHHEDFPSIEIKAGEKYKSRTMMTFGLTTDKHH